YAARHLEVASLVLLAPAFCFARGWARHVGPEAMERWRASNALPVYHYADCRERMLRYQLMEDAEGFEDYPDVRQPTLIFHGTQDTVLHLSLSENFVAAHPNARLRAVDSDHELLNVLEPMWAEVCQFFCVEKIQAHEVRS